ncbi:outer membrane beta-barrel family protein [Pedobacter aquatilis]|uniref:outer membrane beta-barrel family protein n=1 Tax=Pedobacter aquatilis TaxID=351343 RepID=UPI002931656E|nr:outer membrane beta-barrel family protein [Pedobacter aquatilis]
MSRLQFRFFFSATAILIWLSVIPSQTRAQSSSNISGLIYDGETGVKLLNASVTLTNHRDTLLVAFCRSKSDGSFLLSYLPKGKFTLTVSYPQYADFVDTLTIAKDNISLALNPTPLTLKAQLLKEVIVKGTLNSIRLKGDTTEYNAKAFSITPNAKVEDLLIQLPGIKVDNNGRITAYGQSVDKVLVDGEEFFGDDPTLVTRNLRADMIDKVQLFDKQSEQAAFTKSQDGKKIKTINLKLKEDKKKGFFGKIEAGASTQKYYTAATMFNRFLEKEKFAVYGNLGNIGRLGLSGSENSKYASSSENVVFVGGSLMASPSEVDELSSSSGRFSGQGLPEARTAGIHYDAKWSRDRKAINANYKIGALDVSGVRDNFTQNDLSATSLISNSQQSFNNNLFRQKLDATITLRPNPNNTFKISFDGTQKRTASKTAFISSNTLAGLGQLNSTNRLLDDNGHQDLFNGGIFFGHKFKKENRLFSLNVSVASIKNDLAGSLFARTSFFAPSGAVDSVQQIEQLKLQTGKTEIFSTAASWSEPLAKFTSLIINYGLGINNSFSDRKSFNKSATGQFDLLDAEYSNSYDFNQISNQIGSSVLYSKNKISVEAGLKYSHVFFNQNDLITDIQYQRRFNYLNPQVSYRYQFSPQHLIRLNYFGNTLQPSIDQLQPVRNNVDPLNILIGNADLKPSFSNNISLDYNILKLVTGQNLVLALSYNNIVNPIVAEVNIDNAGKTTYQAINLRQKNNSSLYGRINAGAKIKSIDTYLGLNMSVSNTKNYGLSNGLINERNASVLTAGLNLSKSKLKRYDFMLNISPSYTFSSSSLFKQLNNNGSGFILDLTGNIYLPLAFEVRSSINYQYQAKTLAFPQSYELFLWNASVTKKFFKSENLKLSLQANDILNQNQGFRRTMIGTTLTQTNYSTIKQYFMLSLAWDFSKFGTQPNP